MTLFNDGTPIKIMMLLNLVKLTIYSLLLRNLMFYETKFNIISGSACAYVLRS